MKYALVILLLATACASKSARSTAADRENIRGLIRQHLQEFEPCYVKAIEARPGARGKMVVEWNIDKEGMPGSVLVREADESLKGGSECVAEVIQKFKFARPESGDDVTVVYPFYFSENGKSARAKHN